MYIYICIFIEKNISALTRENHNLETLRACTVLYTLGAAKTRESVRAESRIIITLNYLKMFLYVDDAAAATYN